MADIYRVRIKDKKYGPFSYERVIQLLHEGRISHESYIRKNDTKDWVQIKKLKEFETKNQIQFTKPPDPKEMGKKNYSFDIEDIWYLSDRGQITGPYTRDKIKVILKSPNLTKMAYAFKKDKSEVMFIEGFKGDMKDTVLYDKDAQLKNKLTKKGKSTLAFFKHTNWYKAFKKAFYLDKLKKKKILRPRNIIIALANIIIIIVTYSILRTCPFESELIVSRSNKSFPGFLATLLQEAAVKERYCRLSDKSAGYNIYHGKYELYNKYEKKLVEQYFKKGKLHGPHKEFYDNGRPSAKAFYQENILNGKTITWFNTESEEPKIKEECFYGTQGFGECTGYYLNGMKKYFGSNISTIDEMELATILKEGKWHYWKEDGNLDKIIYYRNGVIQHVDNIGFIEIAQIPVVSKPYLSIFSPRGTYAAIATKSKIIIYNFLSKKIVFEHKNDKIIYKLEFSSDDNYLLAQLKDNILVLNIHDEGYTFLISEVDDLISAYITPNSKYLIAISKLALISDSDEDEYATDQYIQAYNLASKKKITEQTYTSQLDKTFVSHNGDLLVAKEARGFQVLDFDSENFTWSHNTKDKVISTNFTPNDQYIIFTTKSKSRRSRHASIDLFRSNFYSLKKRKVHAVIKHGKSVNISAISSNDKYILLKFYDSLKLYSLRLRKIVSTIKLEKHAYFTMFTPDNKNILIGGSDNILYLYSIHRKKIIAKFPHKTTLKSATLGTNGYNIITHSWGPIEGQEQGEAKVINLQTRSELASFKLFQEVKKVSLAPDSNFAVTQFNTQKALSPENEPLIETNKIYDFRNKKIIATVENPDLNRSTSIENKTILFIDLIKEKSEEDDEELELQNKDSEKSKFVSIMRKQF